MAKLPTDQSLPSSIAILLKALGPEVLDRDVVSLRPPDHNKQSLGVRDLGMDRVAPEQLLMPECN